METISTNETKINDLQKKFDEKCQEFFVSLDESKMPQILDFLRKMNRASFNLPRTQSVERNEALAYMTLQNYEFRGSIYLHSQEIFTWDGEKKQYKSLSSNNSSIFFIQVGRNPDLENYCIPIYEYNVLISLLNKICEKNKNSAIAFLKQKGFQPESNKIFTPS